MTQPQTFRHPSFTGRIGVARADITPPVGIYCRNWGAAKHDAAEGVHRPLTLTALTIQPRAAAGSGGEKPLVLIDVDLGWFRSLDLWNDLQSRVLAALAIDAPRFMFALSHTHAAPSLAHPDPSWTGGDKMPAYREKVTTTAIDTARRALIAAVDGTITFHTGRCNLATTRDLRDPAPGKNRVVCGYDPSIKADDTMLVARATDASGKIIATITNYACHPTTLAWDNKLISPDFLGAMRETIEANTGGAPSLFLQGASGELSPRHQYVGDTAVADRHGRQLGHAALAALADMEPAGKQLAYAGVVESGAPLAAWRHENAAPSDTLAATVLSAQLDLKDWPKADELEKERQNTTDRAIEERLRRKRDIRRMIGDGRTFPVPVYAWRLGDAVLVGSMCEAYSATQIELRRRFPGRALMIMNLVNGSLGYLPPASHYDTDLYQVWQTPFARGGMEAMINTMARAIESL